MIERKVFCTYTGRSVLVHCDKRVFWLSRFWPWRWPCGATPYIYHNTIAICLKGAENGGYEQLEKNELSQIGLLYSNPTRPFCPQSQKLIFAPEFKHIRGRGPSRKRRITQLSESIFARARFLPESRAGAHCWGEGSVLPTDTSPRRAWCVAALCCVLRVVRSFFPVPVPLSLSLPLSSPGTARKEWGMASGIRHFRN